MTTLENQTLPEPTEPSTYSKWVPLVIGFFIGPLGLHRIWLGRLQSGIIMFAISGLGLFVIYKHPELVIQVQKGETPTVVPPDFLGGCLMLATTSIWATVDCLRLTVGKFKDGAGFRVSRWL